MAKVKIKGLVTRDTLLKQAENLTTGVVEDVPLTKIRFGIPKQQSPSIQRSIQMEVKGDRFDILPSAMTDLVKEHGLSGNYAHKVPASLILPHLRYFYTGAGAKGGSEIRLHRNDNTILNISHATHLEYIFVETLVEVLEEVIGSDEILGYHQKKCNFDWHGTDISVVERLNFEVLKGDLLFGGIRVRYSPQGSGATQVQAYVFRQICSNGATTEDKIAAFSRKGASTVTGLHDWLKVSVYSAHKSLEDEKDRLQRLTELEMDGHAGEVLESVLKQFGVPLALATEIREKAVSDQVHSLYDVYNIITEVGTHSEFFQEHPQAMRALERVAGNLTRHADICRACHRVL